MLFALRFIGANVSPPRDGLDNRPVAAEQESLPADPPRLGARGEDLTHIVAAFALVFVAGFAVVAFVLLSRRKRPG
jgi:hypothetical protein